MAHILDMSHKKRKFEKMIYNARIKKYNDQMINIMVSSYEYWSDVKGQNQAVERSYDKTDNITRNDSIKRAQDKIYDIAVLNDWEYFITLTFDDSKVNALNFDDVRQAMNKWLNTMRKTCDLSYIIVPELHPTSGRVHLHGLIKGVNLQMIDSGHKDIKGNTIYNFKRWKNGFSTAIKVYGNNLAVAKYITKYITKDMLKLGKLYYAGGNIKREPEIIYTNIDYTTFDGKEYTLECGIKHKYRKDIIK